MNFDFTISVFPQGDIREYLDNELTYVKSALLYADKINLISPLSLLYFQFTDKKNKKDDKSAVALLKRVLPYIKPYDEAFYNQATNTLIELDTVMRTKAYRQMPYIEKLNWSKALKKFAEEVPSIMEELLGSDNCWQLDTLLKNKKIKLVSFNNLFDDIDDYTMEFVNKLGEVIKKGKSFSLFDEDVSTLLKSAKQAGLLDLSQIQERRLKHGGFANETICTLPSFDQATVDEIIDIRKDLDSSIGKFRSRMLVYSDSLKSMP